MKTTLVSAFFLLACLPVAVWAGPDISPQEVCSIFDGTMLQARNYEKTDNGSFECTSGYAELPYGNGEFKDNLAFLAKGTTDRVNLIRLSLTVFSKEKRPGSQEILASDAQKIYNTVFGFEMPDAVRNALIAGNSDGWNVQGSQVQVQHSSWPNGKGYEVQFLIELNGQ